MSTCYQRVNDRRIPVLTQFHTPIAHGSSVNVELSVGHGTNAATRIDGLLRFSPLQLLPQQIHVYHNPGRTMSWSLHSARSGYIPVTISLTPGVTGNVNPGYFSFKVIAPAGDEVDVQFEVLKVTFAGGRYSDGASTVTKLQVRPDALVIGNAQFPQAVLGEPYVYKIPFSGGLKPLQWATLAPGDLRVKNDGLVIGTVETPSYIEFGASVTDASTPQQYAEVDVAINVLQPNTPLKATTLPVYDMYIGRSEGASASISGGIPPYTVTAVSGTLPDGMALTNEAIRGTPTSLGTYAPTMTITDASGTSVNAVLNLHVHAFAHDRDMAIKPGAKRMFALPNLFREPFTVTVDFAFGSSVPGTGFDPPASAALEVLVDDVSLWLGTVTTSPLQVTLPPLLGGPHRLSLRYADQQVASWYEVIVEKLTVTTAAGHSRGAGASVSFNYADWQNGYKIADGQPIGPGASLEQILMFPGSGDDFAVLYDGSLGLYSGEGGHYNAVSIPALKDAVLVSGGSARGHVLAGLAHNGTIYVITQQSGGTWTATATTSVQGAQSLAAVYSADDMLAIVTTAASVEILSLRTGNVRWQASSAGIPSGEMTIAGASSNADATISAICADVYAAKAVFFDSSGASLSFGVHRRPAAVVASAQCGANAGELVAIASASEQNVAIYQRPTHGTWQAVQHAPSGSNTCALALGAIIRGSDPAVVTLDRDSQTMSASATPFASADRLRAPDQPCALALSRRGEHGYVEAAAAGSDGMLRVFKNFNNQPALQCSHSTMTLHASMQQPLSGDRLLLGNSGAGSPLNIYSLRLVGDVAQLLTLSTPPTSLAGGNCVEIVFSGAPQITLPRHSVSGALIIETDDPLYRRVTIPITLSP